MNRDLVEAMKHGIKRLREWPSDKIHLFHHNDTDGLTSGAILKKAFERDGYSVERVSLEKPYPAVLKKIFDMNGEIIVFADFAGRIDPIIARMNGGRNLVIILDHHEAEKSGDDHVINLDPELFGLKGDRDISASVTCYHFARLMNEENEDMAWVASLGAVGDEFFVDGKLVSENLEVTLEAVRQGKVSIDESSREGYRYIFKAAKGDMYGVEFEDYLDTLGGVGFYQNGPEMGVRVCLEGFSEESDEMVGRLRKIKDERFSSEIDRLRRGGLKITPHIQWFSVGERFSPMGVKMIGVFCDYIKRLDFIDADKYIAGFQVIPNTLPGFGEIEINQVKVSMRVPPAMEDRIRGGEIMGLNKLLPEATAKLGGFSDACHSLTAATTVDIGKEQQLVDEMEKILNQR